MLKTYDEYEHLRRNFLRTDTNCNLLMTRYFHDAQHVYHTLTKTHGRKLGNTGHIIAEMYLGKCHFLMPSDIITIIHAI